MTWESASSRTVAATEPAVIMQPRAAIVEPAADRRGAEAGEEHRDREGAGLLAASPAAIGLQDGQEDGEAVVEDAPGDGLGDPEHDDQHPAVEEAAGAGRRGRGAGVRLDAHRSLRAPRKGEVGAVWHTRRTGASRRELSSTATVVPSLRDSGRVSLGVCWRTMGGGDVAGRLLDGRHGRRRGATDVHPPRTAGDRDAPGGCRGDGGRDGVGGPAGDRSARRRQAADPGVAGRGGGDGGRCGADRRLGDGHDGADRRRDGLGTGRGDLGDGAGGREGAGGPARRGGGAKQQLARGARLLPAGGGASRTGRAGDHELSAAAGAMGRHHEAARQPGVRHRLPGQPLRSAAAGHVEYRRVQGKHRDGAGARRTARAGPGVRPRKGGRRPTRRRRSKDCWRRPGDTRGSGWR